MSDLALDVIRALLIPAGLLPVATALVLFRYRRDPSPAARDRWHVSVVMAALGFTTALLAASSVFGWGWGGGWLILPFALFLLASDIVSGKWLLEFWTGGFSERVGGGPETAIEREDRIAGNERRQAEDGES